MDDGNRQAREFWNGAAGERWALQRERIDQSLAAITTALFEVAAPKPGERVLDIGCGCGTTTLELRARVGDRGQVTGVDISQPMLAVARSRPLCESVTWLEADAAAHAFAPEHDLVFSRFGVMFFEDPQAAFANLARALAPAGRFVFACWRALAENAWATVPLAAAGDLVPPQLPVEPGAPGPFALADDARLRGILVGAGLRDVTIKAHDSTLDLGATLEDASAEALSMGPLARAIIDLDLATRDRIRRRVLEALGPYEVGGAVKLPAKVWFVTARA